MRRRLNNVWLNLHWSIELMYRGNKRLEIFLVVRCLKLLKVMSWGLFISILARTKILNDLFNYMFFLFNDGSCWLEFDRLYPWFLMCLAFRIRRTELLGMISLIFPCFFTVIDKWL